MTRKAAAFKGAGGMLALACTCLVGCPAPKPYHDTGPRDLPASAQDGQPVISCKAKANGVVCSGGRCQNETCCMGCIAGLLCDLASKDHSSAGFTFSVLAAVLLAVGGVAVAFGVQPLLVGITGGAWLINATLRRLDVQRVVERSYGISSIGVPLLAGWFLGHGIVTYGFSRESFVVGLALILVIRPLIRVAGWRLGEHLIKAKNPQALSREGESLPFDNTGFVIALVLMMAAPGAAAIGFLAAALLAQIAFGGISRWLLRPAAVAQTRATTWSPRDS